MEEELEGERGRLEGLVREVEGKSKIEIGSVKREYQRKEEELIARMSELELHIG